MVNLNLSRLLEIEKSHKRNYLELISFYNKQLDKYNGAYSLYSYFLKNAIEQVYACDVQIQFLELEIKDCMLGKR